MRVITGSSRGKKLITVEGEELVRPTSEKVKEALFSAIQFLVPGAAVLDLFAGSGQLGIEALSRGAVSAVFVDASRESLAAVRSNLKNCGFERQSRVVCSDAQRYILRASERYDIVFMDPPYKQGLAAQLLPQMSRMLTENGILLCETESKIELQKCYDGLRLKKEYRYGKTSIWYYEKAETE